MSDTTDDMESYGYDGEEDEEDIHDKVMQLQAYVKRLEARLYWLEKRLKSARPDETAK